VTLEFDVWFFHLKIYDFMYGTMHCWTTTPF